jgi:hypothetical protein
MQRLEELLLRSRSVQVQQRLASRQLALCSVFDLFVGSLALLAARFIFSSLLFLLHFIHAPDAPQFDHSGTSVRGQ